MKEFTLITGASSGIGLELARIAWRKKRNLVLLARDEQGLKKVREEILKQVQDDKREIEIFALDLSKDGSAKKVYEFCQHKKIAVTELINNAGFGDYGRFVDSDIKRQMEMINLNIKAVTELTRLFLPSMIKNKSGRIMNLGSIASFLPGPYMNVYYCTKHYVLAFSEGLAAETKGTGVTVTCLCPGPTQSNFGKSARAEKSKIFKSKKLPSARYVAEFGWYQMIQGEVIAIHGQRNRLVYLFSKLAPRSLVSKLVKMTQS